MTTSSVRDRHDDHIRLLALCRIKGLSWHLLAREARRPEGLARLEEGRVRERSTEARKATVVLAAAQRDLARLRDEAAQLLGEALRGDVRLTTVLDENYPLNLRTIFNAPPFLFYRGILNADHDARSVAVVGTREPTPEGVKRAGKMARLLAGQGVTVLSGLARGIDGAAHHAALEAGGRTVAVLGTGIRRVYPPEHRDLAEQIAATGALVSQFWPDTPPTTYGFPRRNITMSGMGQGTVVIEAASTSGAKMQARLALEHGKKVFLVHHLVTEQPWARGYLARGAVEVHRVEDIVEKLRAPAAIRTRAYDANQLSLLAAE
jgi:DNA processing protein